MARLFQPLGLRGLTLKNRVVVSPMQTYSAPEARATAWHQAHLARFALGGAGLVVAEATAVTPEGRSTDLDLGLWDGAQEHALRGLAEAVHACGAALGVQLQHAGRKAATSAPWEGFRPLAPEAGGAVLGPTDAPAAPGGHVPRAMAPSDMAPLVAAYAAAARRADTAGVDLIEIHMAHGYLLHSFLSPLSNTRADAYGGAIEGRMRFPLEVVEGVRAAWPAHKPLACRISSVDGIGIGWSLEDSQVLVKALIAAGVDLVDCSSGGMILPSGQMMVPRGPGFQVPFASQLRRATGACVIAVGGIADAAEAEAVLTREDADLVAIGRAMLADPNWALHAAATLVEDGGWAHWPKPFGWWLERRARAARRYKA
ncbi:2,4-dienoyl-CoA reductase-like NADH-dependent reductase (Old Yellow Enzyme family) [Xanthobacter flavus]|jgi:2,4-dienoyl-CoA reductase-like NADH-dependent reductase (Old Yellow Enzyme family)|uniref:2,4-dienoyl-CoA reductase-like NADH-dependent reductase (Old Yellow Enzyme family) n=2 Tax=Hyphomicrobiales TaxID=356 RepID=A0A9W6FI91_XANFL|nr:NADH:flavin oxidoreductase/NADH oxidase [Xanthobacter flavus]MBA4789477.1 NADH:flavin oxidoreductase/NADH oxidase [Hyphomicrobiales bacterium]MDR6332606.1 2,4-dienoyl-CoA reductase-like NADH-dependent reductase (Old Yellow Enzyme family) [Xanthobacter flavus]GLI20880.1 NADH:flavin oxidoreductase / NADH oxidase [Xanthobacter flavus]